MNTGMGKNKTKHHLGRLELTVFGGFAVAMQTGG